MDFFQRQRVLDVMSSLPNVNCTFTVQNGLRPLTQDQLTFKPTFTSLNFLLAPQKASCLQTLLPVLNVFLPYFIKTESNDLSDLVRVVLPLKGQPEHWELLLMEFQDINQTGLNALRSDLVTEEVVFNAEQHDSLDLLLEGVVGSYRRVNAFFVQSSENKNSAQSDSKWGGANHQVSLLSHALNTNVDLVNLKLKTDGHIDFSIEHFKELLGHFYSEGNVTYEHEDKRIRNLVRIAYRPEDLWQNRWRKQGLVNHVNTLGYQLIENKNNIIAFQKTYNCDEFKHVKLVIKISPNSLVLKSMQPISLRVRELVRQDLASIKSNLKDVNLKMSGEDKTLLSKLA